MRITTITPVYNNALYLEECIQSLLNQTYEDIELIFVDDGSTDESREILNKYEGYPNVKLLFKEKNEGIASAYRTAVSHATGDALMLLDADDIALPERAAKVAKIFLNQPNVGMVYSKLDLIDHQGSMFNLSLELPTYLNNDNLYMNLFRRGFFTGSGLSVRNEPWLRFDLDLICCDYFITLQFAASNYEYFYYNEALTRYRIHSQNTSNQTQRMKKDVLKVQSEFSLIDLEKVWLEKGRSKADILTTNGIKQYYFEDNQLASEITFSESLLHGVTEEALFYLGYLHYIKGEMMPSLDYFNQANAIFPNRFHTIHNIGILTALTKKNKEESLCLLQKSRKLQPFYLLITKNMESIQQGDWENLRLIHFLSDQDAICNTYCRMKVLA